MFFFPLINFTFLIILYFIHKPIFWIMLLIEAILYIGGIWWIYQKFQNPANHALYIFTLTGIGFIMVFIAFFIAIFLNNHRKS